MMITYRDLCYVRVHVDDLKPASAFATDIFGLQPADWDETQARFRSDARGYALSYTRTEESGALALTVADAKDLDAAQSQLARWAPRRLTADEALACQVKAGLAVRSPNGVTVELVWRPLISGWRYHGPRDAGITGFQAVQLACTDITANETFWTEGLGARVSDWAGEATFLAIDAAHHRVALYPSERNGILGAVWAVESINNVMQGWYHFQACQLPIIHGPGRQPTSGAVFVTTKGPGGMFYTYAAETEEGPQIAARGPRQFADGPAAHCAWGSPSKAPEFLGGQRK